MPPVVQNKLVTITPVILHPVVGGAQQSTAQHGEVSPEAGPEGPAAKKQRVDSLPGVRNCESPCGSLFLGSGLINVAR